MHVKIRFYDMQSDTDSLFSQQAFGTSILYQNHLIQIFYSSTKEICENFKDWVGNKIRKWQFVHRHLYTTDGK